MVYTTLNRTKKQTSSTSGRTAESLPASVAEKSQRNQVTQPTIIEAVGKRAPPCAYAAFQTTNKLSFYNLHNIDIVDIFFYIDDIRYFFNIASA